MPTWNGISFGHLHSSDSYALGGVRADITEHQLLSGTVVYTPSGKVDEPVKLRARCTDAQVNALVRNVGQVGTLALDLERYPDSVLMEVSPTAVLASGLYFVDLVFETNITEVVNPAFGVVIGGREVANVIAVQTNVGRKQKNATALLHCLGLPPGADADDVQVYVSTGGGAELIFRGDYHSRAYSFYPGVVTVACTGLKARMKKKWGGPDRIYNPSLQPDEGGIIQNLVEATGIPASRTSIESTGWVMGVIEDVIIKNGDSFEAWIDTVDEMAGMVTYDGSDGALYRRDNDPTATGNSVISLVEGQNVLSARRQRGGPETVVNQCTVTGLTYEDAEIVQEYSAGSSVLDAFQPPELAGYKQGVTIKSDLIETDPKALSIATQIVTRGNRRDDGLEIQMVLTPGIRPGDGALVLLPSCGVTSATQVLILDVKHDIQGITGTTTLYTNIGGLQ